MIDVDGVLTDLSAHEAILVDEETPQGQRWHEFLAHIPGPNPPFQAADERHH